MIVRIEDLTPEYFTLEESKALGTLDQPLTARELALSLRRLPRRAQVRKKKRLSRASKLQKSLADRLYKDLLGLVNGYIDKEGDVTFKKLKRGSEFIIRDTYKKVFDAAMDSAKVAMVGEGDIVTSEEKRWLKTAINAELRYWKKLLDDAKTGKLSSRNAQRRVRMYADTVRSVYDAARVLATPANVLLVWVTRGDNKICDSCKYMASKSPFTKQTIPVVPRDGSSICLSNCRCRLVIKNVDYDKWEKRNKQLPKKETMLKDLAKIKKRRRKSKKESIEAYTDIPALNITDFL